MIRLREEKRMRLYAVGAQRAVQDVGLKLEFGDDAHLVERAMTLQTIATTPDAGKAAVMADTALQRAQGYDTRDKDGDPLPAVAAAINHETAIVMERVLRAVLEAQDRLQLHDTIEGEVKGE